MSAPYHSALHEPRPAPWRDYVRWPNGSVALRHNLLAGPLPPEFTMADVLYTDLPWRAGQATFDERAQVPASTHRQLLAALAPIVAGTARPAIFVIGASFVRDMPGGSVQQIATNLNGAAAIAMVYGSRVRVDASNARRILASLAGQYECVGDFCCGYGSAARAFHEQGKRFVVSDYNGQCIGMVATLIP